MLGLARMDTGRAFGLYQLLRSDSWGIGFGKKADEVRQAIFDRISELAEFFLKCFLGGPEGVREWKGVFLDR